jgi:hypothetical protein
MSFHLARCVRGEEPQTFGIEGVEVSKAREKSLVIGPRAERAWSFVSKVGSARRRGCAAIGSSEARALDLLSRELAKA